MLCRTTPPHPAHPRHTLAAVLSVHVCIPAIPGPCWCRPGGVHHRHGDHVWCEPRPGVPYSGAGCCGVSTLAACAQLCHLRVVGPIVVCMSAHDHHTSFLVQMHAATPLPLPLCNCGRSVLPRSFTIQLADLPPLSVVNASHSYPYGSVNVQTVGDPAVTGVSVTITIWATEKYLSSVDVSVRTAARVSYFALSHSNPLTVCTCPCPAPLLPFSPRPWSEP